MVGLALAAVFLIIIAAIIGEIWYRMWKIQ